jgi:hypothetical protein
MAPMWQGSRFWGGVFWRRAGGNDVVLYLDALDDGTLAGLVLCQNAALFAGGIFYLDAGLRCDWRSQSGRSGQLVAGVNLQADPRRAFEVDLALMACGLA